MTTLVTGATGLVGINVVRRLVKAGEKVRVFARPSKQPRVGLSDLGVETAHGDVTDLASLETAMKGVRRVYHVAGATSQGPWASVRRWLEEVNVRGTANVCAAARRAGVERLVHTSTICAVGHGSRESPADETSPWNYEALRSPYYDTKRAAEDVVRREIEQGLDAVIVCPGFMLGPWDIKPTSGVSVLLAAKWRRGIPAYPAGGGNNVLDVEDAAAGHVLAMEKGRKGERYILGNENLTWREIFTLANEVAGKPPPWLPLWYPPTWPLALAGDLFGRFAPERFDTFNTLVLRAGRIGMYVSNAKARKELGLPVTPVRESMKKCLEWFQQNGYLERR